MTVRNEWMVDHADAIISPGREPRRSGREGAPRLLLFLNVLFRAGSRRIDDRINTSYVERQNLTMRMSMRRFTRLTNGFSRKLENLRAAVALHFGHFNWCRIHETTRITPAMAAGLTDHVWTIEELVAFALSVPRADDPYGLDRNVAA